MIQPIVLFGKGTDVLQRQTSPIDITDENAKSATDQLILDLMDTVRAVGGLGLAANQIAIMKSVCVCKLGNDFVSMVNPEIINISEATHTSTEACLSLPSVVANITRHDDVQVKFINSNWQEEIITVEYPHSVVVQHEIDHLNGILLLNHMKQFELQLIATKLKRMGRGNIPINYVGMVWNTARKTWVLVGNHQKLSELHSYRLKVMTDYAKTMAAQGDVSGSSEAP